MRRARAAAVVALVRDAGDHPVERNPVESIALDLEDHRGIGVDSQTADRLFACARDLVAVGADTSTRSRSKRPGRGTEVPSLAT